MQTPSTRELEARLDNYTNLLPDEIADIALSDFGIVTTRMPDRDRCPFEILRETARQLAVATAEHR